MKNFLYVIIILVALSSCGSKENKETPSVAKAEVKTFLLQSEQAESTINLPGELKPYQEVDIYAKVNSFVKDVPVDRGTEVKKGQTLLLLDAPEIESQLAEAASKLKTREAVSRSSKATYFRLAETNKTSGAVSPDDLERAQSKMMADSSEVSSARANYKATADIKAYLNVEAPFEGNITERNIHPGAFVGPSGKGSETPLLRLEQQDLLRLVVAVPEANLENIHVNDEVKFSVRSYPGEVFVAKVSRLAGSIDASIRSEMIEMDVINKEKKLLPGMYAQVELKTKRDTKSFLVPKTAVVTLPEKVFVVKVENGKAKRIEVTKGNASSDRMEIFGQLFVNDKLVLEASEGLREGDEIGVK